MSPHFTLYRMVLHTYINFVISKQNKIPNTDPKNVEAVAWYCYSTPVYNKNKQSFIIKYK